MILKLISAFLNNEKWYFILGKKEAFFFFTMNFFSPAFHKLQVLIFDSRNRNQKVLKLFHEFSPKALIIGTQYIDLAILEPAEIMYLPNVTFTA